MFLEFYVFGERVIAWVRGGGVYSYIHVLPDGFLLKAIVFTVYEHKYMNITPPPPIIVSSYGPSCL